MSDTNTPSYTSVNLSIPYVVPASTPLELVPLIKPIYLAFQNIIQALINYCGIAPRSPTSILSSADDPSAFLANNVHRFYASALETIAQGALINLTASNGSIFIQNANATDNTKPADGFCSQIGGLTFGQVGEVILGDGMITGLSGLTPGGRLFLSTSPGGLTATAPTASGNIAQQVGIAITPNAFRFLIGQTVQH